MSDSFVTSLTVAHQASSAHGIYQARILGRLPFPSPKNVAVMQQVGNFWNFSNIFDPQLVESGFRTHGYEEPINTQLINKFSSGLYESYDNNSILIQQDFTKNFLMVPICG